MGDSFSGETLHTRCHLCAFRLPGCFCAAIPRVENQLEIVVVRHAAELTKTTGSVRWAALALQRCTVLDYALPERAFDDAALDLEGALLLFPSPHEGPPAHRPRRLFVPDGTWQQARRIVSRSPALRALPRLALPKPASAARLRKPPLESGMSTLEAIADALEVCGEPGPAEALRQVYRAALERVGAARGRAFTAC
jgi:DTW domain-containing protein YfiP